MTCVPHTGYVYSAELWRFSTSTLVWERGNSTAANGAGPSARYDHVMTSVGLDLWVQGGSTGSGEGDAFDYRCCCSPARSRSDCVCCGVVRSCLVRAGAGSSDELFSLNVGRTWNWSDIQDFGLTVFTRIYDNDVIQVYYTLFK